MNSLRFAQILSFLLLLASVFGNTAQAQVSTTFSLTSNDSPFKRWYVPQTERPPGTTTQWMSFWVYSSSFFRNATRAHFAIGVRGGLTPTSVSGRGITLGHTEEVYKEGDNVNYGCADYLPLPEGSRPGMSQIESFFPGGNRLFPTTCRPFAGYKDGTWYRVTIHANDTNWIAYWIDDAKGDRIDAGHEPAVPDFNSPFNLSLTGLFIVYSGDGGAAYRGPWKMRFDGIRTGWF